MYIINITADRTVRPPIISGVVIISLRKYQTHIGPKILSKSTNKLISAAGRYGVAHVTNAIPSPIVKKPIKTERTMSWTFTLKPLLRINDIIKASRQEKKAPKNVPPKTSCFSLFLA